MSGDYKIEMVVGNEVLSYTVPDKPIKPSGERTAQDYYASALDGAYRERAQLVVYLAKQYRSYIAYSAGDKRWPIVYIETPAGQLSWHINKSDMDLFANVELAELDSSEYYDGHTVAEKYERLSKL
jgi:hypothetical protein